MSSICGIYNFDNQRAEKNSLFQMAHSLRVNNDDIFSSICKDNFALGKLEVNAQPFPGESKPFTENAEGSVVTSISRIYNKEELFDKLSIPQPQRSSISDSQIILKCFEKWKYDSPEHILGEWMFVLWNNPEKELLIAASHYYNPCLYYYKTNNAFYFSSSLKALSALDEIPQKLNEFRLGQLLIGWNFDFGKTLYKDISYLGPAHLLRISANRFETKRYWKLEDTPPVRFKNDDEYVEAFKELYTKAVKCRGDAGINIGSSLSGGLDSGSVTALAAKTLKEHGKNLQAFSSVPIWDVKDFWEKNRFGDETEFINATAKHAGNVDVNFIRSENISPLQGVKRLVQTFGEPTVVSANIYWLLSMLGTAQLKGLDTFLIGQVGNMTVSWAGYFTGFINWYKFLNRFKENGITNPANIFEAVKSDLIMPMLPSKIYHQFKKWRSPILRWEQFSPVNIRFAEKQKFKEQMNEKQLIGISRDPREIQLSVIKPESGLGASWFELGRQHNLWIADPTADKSLLEFCISIPNNQFYRKGTDKYLFKRAMKGVLPDKVLFNKKRGRQAADLQQRLKQDLPEIKSIIESFKKSEICNHYLDVKRIEAAIPLIEQKSVLARQQTAMILLKGIQYGLFLQKFE